MPPVLNVTLPELAARAQQQMLTHQLWFGVNQCHDILQLVAKAAGAA